MDTLIIYDTKTGTTKKCVDLIISELNGNADSVSIENIEKIDIKKYKKIVIGSYINASFASKRIKSFCNKYVDYLLTKQIYLFFSSYSTESKDVETYLSANFDKRLIDNAMFKDSLGGEFNMEKLKGFKKFFINMLIKGIEKDGKQMPKIKEENIEKLVNIINNF